MEERGEGWVARHGRAVTKEETSASPQGSGPSWECEDGNVKRRGQTPCGMKGFSPQNWKLREREGTRYCEKCREHPS